MRLSLAITIHAGGPGSGCNPEAGQCGRPKMLGPGPGLPKWTPKNGQTQVFFQDQTGHYHPQRAVLHSDAIKKYQHRPTVKNPVVQVIAGGTASGKTTASRELFKGLRTPAIVNVDLPRADLPEFQQVVGTSGMGLLQEEASDIRDKILMSAAGHNNDIAVDAVGSSGLAAKMDALERAGYQVKVAYVHSPVDESVGMAKTRAATATDPADQRAIPEPVTRMSHEKARAALPLLMKPGREAVIYDRTGKKAGENYDVIYHRLPDGKVVVRDDDKLERMRNAPGEKQIQDIF